MEWKQVRAFSTHLAHLGCGYKLQPQGVKAPDFLYREVRGRGTVRPERTRASCEKISTL
jgi:hypothetical protein